MRAYTAFLKKLFTKLTTWVYLALIMLSAEAGFTLTVLYGGSSKLMGTFGYILTAMLLFVPLLTAENRLNGISDSKELIHAFFSFLTVELLAIVPTVYFAVIISEYGVFKLSLYICNIVSVICLGAILTAVYMFIGSFFRKKGAVYAASYIFVAVVLACEVLYSFIEHGLAAKLVCIFSLTKYYGAFSLGIIDLRTVLLAVLIPLVLILLHHKAVSLRRHTA